MKMIHYHYMLCLLFISFAQQTGEPKHSIQLPQDPLQLVKQVLPSKKSEIRTVPSTCFKDDRKNDVNDFFKRPVTSLQEQFNEEEAARKGFELRVAESKSCSGELPRPTAKQKK